MRVAALAIVTIATVFAAPPAHAQTYDPAYPVCLQVNTGVNDYYFECSYTTMAQCQMSASGRSAYCLVNPYYKGGKKAPRKARDRRVN